MKHRGRHLALGLVREGEFRLKPSEGHLRDSAVPEAQGHVTGVGARRVSTTHPLYFLPLGLSMFSWPSYP